MTIDNLTPDDWPAEAVTALDRWRQGHLIQADLGVWLAAGNAMDLATGYDLSNEPAGLHAMTAEMSDTGYMAVISQTCDIAAEGPGKRHPFVQVCPVRDVGQVFDEDKIQQLREGKLVEYVYLTNPPIDGVLAVDLRVSMPVSKGLLIGRNPIVGFDNEREELDLGARVAAKIERPALHDYLSRILPKDLDKFLDKAKRSQEWCDEVEQLRLELDGDRLAPKRVRLIVVTDTNFNRFINRKGPLRDRWKTHKKPLREAGIAQEPILFRHIDQMPISQYRESIPLDVPALGRGRFA